MTKMSSKMTFEVYLGSNLKLYVQLKRLKYPIGHVRTPMANESDYSVHRPSISVQNKYDF